MQLELRKVKDLTEDNFCDTLLLLKHLKDRKCLAYSKELLDDIIDIIAESYKNMDIDSYDCNKSAYLVFNRIN